MNNTKWIDNAREKSVRSIAKTLGATVQRDRITCPSCSDKRASLFSARGREVWRCHRCSAWGDGIAYVAYSVTGRAMDKNNADAVREWFGEPREFVPMAKPEPKRYPPREEMKRFVWSCGNVDGACKDWIKSRLGEDVDITGLGLAGSIDLIRRPPSWAEFRRQPWNHGGYRLIFPAFDHDGDLRSCRARCLVERKVSNTPKTLPPRGFAFAGLAMANPEAVRMLKGSSKAEVVIVVEGEPGFLACAVTFRDAAVLGIVAGSWSVEMAMKCGDRPVVVVTDHDKPGDKYFAKIKATLDCERAPFGSPDEVLLKGGKAALVRAFGSLLQKR